MSALTFNYAMLYKYGKHMHNYYMHLIDYSCHAGLQTTTTR